MRKNKLKIKRQLLAKNLKLRNLQTVYYGHPYKWQWVKWLAKPKRKWSLRLNR